ncbi:MAG TPA: TlpA disulfide reductase family protein, partial [Anaeromyxobacteraceae bacterium]|nr:TlpA disulfide reductase family protein [Anaeromyxobacteraceae bacterium]
MRLAAAALLLAIAPGLAAAEDEIGVGLPAPGFSLKTLNPDVAGTTWLPLDRYVGEGAEDPGAKLVLLSFFASWCGPCKKELPFLAQLDAMYRPQGLRVVGISLDKDEAGIEAAKRLIAANKVGYPVLSDRFNFLAKRYLGDAAPLPSVFLVARDGTVVRIEKGYAKDASAFLLAEVQAALGLRAAPAV